MKKETEEVRPSSIDSDTQVVEMKTTIDDLSKLATALEVKNEVAQATASDMRIQIKEMQKKLKARLNWFIEPAQKYVKFMKNSFELIFTKLDFADEVLEGKMVSFYEEQERLLKEEQAKLIKKNEKLLGQGKIPIAIPESIDTSVQSAEGKTIFTKAWVCDIIDPDKVPREYCDPNQAKLNSAIKQGILNIDGCIIREETRTTRR